MKVIKTVADWHDIQSKLQPQTIGLVPTMGNLHRGHMSLIDASQRDNANTVVSCFVNPTQFNKTEDYDNYPTTKERDIELCAKMGVDFLFLPTPQTMYPCQYEVRMNENSLSQIMEGVHRPGHFEGVLTIVLKLLNIFSPNKVYFGQKDYQQLLLVKKMIRALFINTDVIACPTIRDQNGIALSSRNTRLSNSGLLKLEKFAKIFHSPTTNLKERLKDIGVDVEYIENFDHRCFIAFFIENIRLIDNKPIN